MQNKNSPAKRIYWVQYVLKADFFCYSSFLHDCGLLFDRVFYYLLFDRVLSIMTYFRYKVVFLPIFDFFKKVILPMIVFN